MCRDRPATEAGGWGVYATDRHRFAGRAAPEPRAGREGRLFFPDFTRALHVNCYSIALACLPPLCSPLLPSVWFLLSVERDQKKRRGREVWIRFYSLDCCSKEENCFAVCKSSFCSSRQRTFFYTTSQVLRELLIYFIPAFSSLVETESLTWCVGPCVIPKRQKKRHLARSNFSNSRSRRRCRSSRCSHELFDLARVSSSGDRGESERIE